MDMLHLKAPRGWINDPNGFIFYKGKYHLFYQHFPYAARWGRMHWGHAVSRDLVSWQHLETALFPTKPADADGCFSGSAVEKDGVMHLFYTGVKYDAPDPENVNVCLDGLFTAAQLHISSPDGYSFDNFGGKSVVIPPITDPKRGDMRNTRDPKVWRGADGWYMVLGSTVNNNGLPEPRGRLLFYKSADLCSWEYAGFAEADIGGWMWECPDYFRTDGGGVLLLSPLDMPCGSQALCTLAEFDERECRMEISPRYQFLDLGLDLYAPQSALDSDGRRVVAAWLRMPEPMRSGAVGMFCIPRVCEAERGHIFFRPHPNIRARFCVKTDKPQGAYMVRAALRDGETLDIGGYVLSMNGGRLTADRTRVMKCGQRPTAATPPLNGADIEAYVDENIIEVFVNGGEYVITHAVYGITGVVRGSAEVFVMG